MRLDHIAYRVADRKYAAKYLEALFGYKIAEEFCIDFTSGQAKCYALRPPEQLDPLQPRFTSVILGQADEFCSYDGHPTTLAQNNAGMYHLAPEIFVSDGTPDSVVGRWVAARNGVGGIHHLAYEVPNVKLTMFRLQSLGVEFTTNEPIVSKKGDLVQIFTVEDPTMGVIYEFIERRGNRGFNLDNVKQLMLSTDEQRELSE